MAKSKTAEVATVGRTVHYFDPTGAGPFAAVVTAVDEAGAAVSLFVMPPHQSARAEDGVAHSNLAEAGSARWDWPPRVEVDAT